MVGDVEGEPAAPLRPAGDDVLKVWPVQQAGEESKEQWGGIAGGGWVMLPPVQMEAFASLRLSCKQNVCVSSPLNNPVFPEPRLRSICFLRQCWRWQIRCASPPSLLRGSRRRRTTHAAANR